MKIKDLIRELESWKNYKECDLKVRFEGKDVEIDKIHGMVPNLILTLKNE